MSNKKIATLNNIQELLSSITNPFMEQHKMLGLIPDSLREQREMLGLIPDSLREQREMLGLIPDSLREQHEMLGLIPDSLREQREMLASIAEPMRELREIMSPITDPLREHRELMQLLCGPLQEFHASFEDSAYPLKEFSNAISDIDSFQFLKNVAYEISEGLSFQEEGHISLASKRIAVSELQDLSYQIIHDASLEQGKTLEDSINLLIEEIRSHKDPITQKLLIWFIYPLIVTVIASFITPAINHYVESHLSEDKRTLSKNIETKTVQSVTNISVLKDFRYVTADILNVRLLANKKSEAIGSLYFGYSVIVLDRQKSWTLIEWNDPNSEVRVTGWVFSRYLAKFN